MSDLNAILLLVAIASTSFLLFGGRGWFWRFLRFMRLPSEQLRRENAALREQAVQALKQWGLDREAYARITIKATEERDAIAAKLAAATAAGDDAARLKAWGEQLEAIRAAAEAVRQLNCNLLYDLAEAIRDGDSAKAVRVVGMLQESDR
jgi:hypothetical protein